MDPDRVETDNLSQRCGLVVRAREVLEVRRGDVQQRLPMVQTSVGEKRAMTTRDADAFEVLPLSDISLTCR